MRHLLIILVSWTGAPTVAEPAAPASVPVEQTASDGASRTDTTSLEAEIGREAVEALEIPPLVFEPPEADAHEILGVPVYHLRDPALPLVDVHVRLTGGSGHLQRDQLAASSALPSLLRSGGTRTLPPDSVERRLDLMALQLSVQTGGGGAFISLNALTEHVTPGMELLGDLLLDPGFDEEALETWRRAELERIRRRRDSPGSLAYSEFNRLLFGDHPVGWVLRDEDLAPERLSETRLRALHQILYCRDRLILGVAGDLSWEDAEPLVQRFVERWPECTEDLSQPPSPDLRREGAVFVLPRTIEQSTVIMAGPGGVRQEASSEYFASRIANHILGGGGLGSRLSAKVRTEQGLAYSASSVWTTPIRYEGLVGAVTATAPERTVEATAALREVLSDFREEPPTSDEVNQAIEQITNGFVFAFESPSQIVSRRIGYRAQGLPATWLESYFEGLQGVTPEAVHAVAREHIALEEMTVLVVGDPERFDPGLYDFGPVFELRLDGSYEPWVSPASEPRESRQSLR